MKQTDLSIIIVNWNTRQLLLNCIRSIYETVRSAAFEVIVVDNASTDGSVGAVHESFPAVRILVNSRNMGFAAANNKGIGKMKGRYAVLLNSDVILKEKSLERMIQFMEQHPDAGMCGPQLLNEDGSRQNSVGNFPTLLSEFMSKKLIQLLFPRKYKLIYGSYSTPREGGVVDFIVGACMVVKREAIDEVGMLDEDYFFLYEELDWCFRMKKGGWSVYHIPDVEIYHLGGQSMKGINLRARTESWRSRYLFFSKSLGLSPAGQNAVLLLGFSQNAWQLLVYTLLNVGTLFSLKRLRSRLKMFLYLLIWHLKGRPVSMGIPR